MNCFHSVNGWAPRLRPASIIIFFFQAEDGIRDHCVTGVQTCALPILTDEMLEWQTAKLLELETRHDGHVVHVRPELVVEVAFNGIQASPTYPGGLALRFARIVRYRPDKGPDQSDTIETVRELHRREVGET